MQYHSRLKDIKRSLAHLLSKIPKLLPCYWPPYSTLFSPQLSDPHFSPPHAPRAVSALSQRKDQWWVRRGDRASFYYLVGLISFHGRPRLRRGGSDVEAQGKLSPSRARGWGGEENMLDVLWNYIAIPRICCRHDGSLVGICSWSWWFMRCKSRILRKLVLIRISLY